MIGRAASNAARPAVRCKTCGWFYDGGEISGWRRDLRCMSAPETPASACDGELEYLNFSSQAEPPRERTTPDAALTLLFERARRATFNPISIQRDVYEGGDYYEEWPEFQLFMRALAADLHCAWLGSEFMRRGR